MPSEVSEGDTPLPKIARNERKIAAAILIFWSQMHGLTLLLMDELVDPAGKSDELCESVLQGSRRTGDDNSRHPARRLGWSSQPCGME